MGWQYNGKKTRFWDSLKCGIYSTSRFRNCESTSGRKKNQRGKCKILFKYCWIFKSQENLNILVNRYLKLISINIKLNSIFIERKLFVLLLTNYK